MKTKISKHKKAKGFWWKLFVLLLIVNSRTIAQQMTTNDKTVHEKKISDTTEIMIMKIDNDTIYTFAEEMPAFPGGDQGLMEYVNKNIKYPEEAKVEGRVFIGFVIEKDGSVNEVKVIRGIGELCDNEAIRMVKSMPNWKPGQIMGQPVRVRFQLPVNFKKPKEDYAERSNNLQKPLQYKGKFEMSGFGNTVINTGIYSAKKNGFAQYEYREAADGTRIFEGDFYFATIEKDLSSLMRKDIVSLLMNSTNYSSKKLIEAAAILAPFALGKLKNDKQVGKWIWGYWADGMFVFKEISYDDYGNANGPIKQYRYAINYGEFRHSASYRNNNSIYYPSGWLIGEFVDNILVSADYRVGYEEVSNYNRVTDPYEVSGKFNRRGPVGRWSVSGGYFEDNGKYTVVEFDNNGNCIANYWIDQSTGDKKFPQYINSSNNPIQYIKQAQTSIYNMVNSSCFRSTKKQE